MSNRVQNNSLLSLFALLFYFPFSFFSRLEYRPASSAKRNSKEEEENPEIFKSTAF